MREKRPPPYSLLAASLGNSADPLLQNPRFLVIFLPAAGGFLPFFPGHAMIKTASAIGTGDRLIYPKGLPPAAAAGMSKPMNFISLPFFLFFPAAVLGYHLLPRRARAVWLLLASWVFYLFSGAAGFPFLLGAILASYAAGRLMEAGHRRRAAAAAVVLCAGTLFVLKYLQFFLSLAAEALNAWGLAVSSPALRLLLPAGISFYLFQAIGYVIDVYRGDQPAQRSLVRHALFLSFFPQLLSGPIARAPQLMPQLEDPPDVTWDGLRQGSFRFLWGAFKKLVIADRLAVLVNTVYAAPGDFGRLQVLAAMLAFSLQIYCDFSAYSDMALGTAQAMGFTLTENFRSPYFSRTIQEFWRRWHISLSSWFRDYLYIPLGGSRRGRRAKYRNLLIVFAVSGLWHGAGLTFLVWGLLHGAYQVIGAVTAPWRDRLRTRLGLRRESLPVRIFQTGCTFSLVTLAWVFFHAADLSAALAVFSRLLSGPLWVPLSAGLDRWDCLAASAALLVLLAAEVSEARMPLSRRWLEAPAPVRWITALGLLLAAAVLGCYGPGYDAQAFIYFKF